MSELFMECVEEELEPWQKQVPQIHLIEDDDDEPIFVGVLCKSFYICVMFHIQWPVVAAAFLKWIYHFLFSCWYLVPVLFISKCLYASAATNQKDTKATPSAPPKRTAEKQEHKCPATQPAVAPSQIMLPLNISANTVNAASQSLTTLTPQPVIVNNQVFLLQILTNDCC